MQTTAAPVTCASPRIQLNDVDASGRRSGAHSDRELLERIAAGDQPAMRLLFARHRDAVYRFALRLTKDEALAEDVLIETFFDAWRFAGRFEGRSAPSTWLLAIARNKAVSALRRTGQIEVDVETAMELPDPAADPEAALAAKDRSEAIRRCLASLSAKQTEVIDLVYYHGKTIAQVAAILHVPEATVKTRMFCARRRLAELLRNATVH